MTVLHINTYSHAGAAKACIRLHLGLLSIGVDSHLLLLERSTDAPIPNCHIFAGTARGIARYAQFARRKYFEFRNTNVLRNRVSGFEIFSFPDAPFDVTRHPVYAAADVVNLHWVSRFLNYESFFRRNTKRLVWTLHDVNPFSGGCHYPGSCRKFQQECSECPQLEGTGHPGYAHGNLVRKRNAFHSLGQNQMTIVALSNWMMQESETSALFGRFPHRLIPNGIDSLTFRPLDKAFCREVLGLPPEKKVVLFVGESLEHKRKGGAMFVEAIKTLSDNEDVIGCIVARGSPAVINQRHFHQVGRVADEALMNVAYCAADAYVVAAVEDNLPNTVMESLMSGTPVIGFAIGGIPDMVREPLNGLLSKEVSSQGLAATIRRFFAVAEHWDRETIRKDAVARFGSRVQARAYLSLYQEILQAD